MLPYSTFYPTPPCTIATLTPILPIPTLYTSQPHLLTYPLLYPTLTYSTQLSLPTLPCPAQPCPTVPTVSYPYTTLPYPSQPYSILEYPTTPYPTSTKHYPTLRYPLRLSLSHSAPLTQHYERDRAKWPFKSGKNPGRSKAETSWYQTV